jgi:hypothetical protein
LKNFEQIAARVSPELMFSFDGDAVEYRQHWVTIWARQRAVTCGEHPSHSKV